MSRNRSFSGRPYAGMYQHYDSRMDRCRSVCPGAFRWKESSQEKNPEAKNELYCVPFIKEKGKKKIPAARWLVPESSGRHVAFFTRYQTYKMSNKGLVGIVNPKLNVTEPSAYFWKSDEKSPVFLGQYLFFQNSNKKMIALVERYFEDDPAMLEQIRQRRWLGKGGGVAALFAFVAEHYVPQQEQE